MQNELVSIIMPSYNSVYIPESIESVIAQSYKNWELLITDDCSTDSTREIVSGYTAKDPRIKLFVLEQNSGAGVARNNSIKQAQGRFIAFCDSDDMWLPEKLEKQVQFMLEHKYEFVFSSYYSCSEDAAVDNFVKCKSRVDLFSLIKDSSIGCLTAIYDTSRIGKIYMPTIRKRQDWGLWLTIIQKCKYGYGIKESLAKYRVCSNSISSKKMALVKYNVKVYSVVLGYSLIKSYLIFFFLFLPSYFIKKCKLAII